MAVFGKHAVNNIAAIAELHTRIRPRFMAILPLIPTIISFTS
jgi:hypothetical protein